MNPLFNTFLKDQLQVQFYNQAAKTLNLNQQQSQNLVVKALPTLLKGLATNTQSKNGVESLLEALKQKKHHGKILNSNADFFAASQLNEGDKILKHILGDTRDDIASALAIETKIDTKTAQKVLAALSLIIMSGLGKAVQSKKLNADQVSKLLNLAVKDKNYAQLGKQLGLLLWDKNNNGQFKDDLFEIGKTWLSKVLNKKR